MTLSPCSELPPMQVAAYVGWLLVAICAALCALTAWCSWRACTAARKVRSTTSMQGELHEIRDYMGKIDAWAKRINARETMRERRESEPAASSTRASIRSVSDKDELRRRAGLVAGKPARHGE